TPGVDAAAGPAAAVSVFVLTLTRGSPADSWPPPGGDPFALYLTGAEQRDGCARGRTRRLSTDTPGREDPDYYEYDPRDPVMSLDTWRSRAVDQAPHDGRADVLRYVADPLRGDVLVIGEPELVLYAASSARDTDFVARLIEVRRDGTTVVL